MHNECHCGLIDLLAGDARLTATQKPAQRIDDNKAAALGLTGLPSVFVNGKELQRQELGGFS